MAKLDRYQLEAIRNFREDIAACTSVPQVMSVAKVLVAMGNQQWFRNTCWPELSSKLKSFNRTPIKVAVIDLSQHVHAIWHLEQDEDNRPRAIIERVERLETKFPGHRFVYACDSRPSFRHELSKKFKGDREEKQPEFFVIEDIAIAKLRSLGKMVVQCSGYESDDVMASIATDGAILGDDIVLCTNDRDLWQVLGPKVQMWHKDEFFTRDSLKEKHGIRPDQAVDWMCMVGKNGMGGLKGVGPERASQLLELYGDMLGIIDAYCRGEDLPKADWEDWKITYWDQRVFCKLVRSLDVPYPY